MSKCSDRLNNVVRKINFIENIVRSKNGIISALDDEENSRASILMHLTSIAEQFDKLSKDGEFEILSKFDKNDLKGSYDIRNYIVHDYEGLNLMIIEVVIREKLPKIKEVALSILDKNHYEGIL